MTSDLQVLFIRGKEGNLGLNLIEGIIHFTQNQNMTFDKC